MVGLFSERIRPHLVQGCRRGRCSKSAAISGTPAVALTCSGRRLVTYGPAVRRKRFSSIRQIRSCINVSGLCLELFCSGPSWISAHMRSHYRTGLDWAIWVASVRTRREDRFLHRRLILSQTSAGGLGYIIDSSSHFCSFVCAWRPFFRPGLARAVAPRAGAVKAGRRAGPCLSLRCCQAS
jgi:hypothetical protein